MKQRAITAFFFVLAMLGGIFGGKIPFLLLFGFIAGGSIWELNELMLPAAEPNRLLRKIVGVGLGIFPLLVLAIYLSKGKPMEASSDLIANCIFPGVIAWVSGIFLFELFQHSGKPFSNIGNYLLGLFYVGIPICLLLYISMDGSDYHPNRVIGLLLLTWTNDTMAYVIGSKIGKSKLFERISPNKTWEGTIGGALCAILVGWILAQFFEADFTLQQWMIFGAVVGIFGTIGDLVESMLKRSVGVKDSGNLLPGHGGLLDRFDAFIFVLPFIWLAMRMMGN